MKWEVNISRKALKVLKKLPNPVKAQLFLLLKDIEISGPIRGNWPNYNKLGKKRHHCHLKKGHPTYVAVWEKQDDDIKIVEVIYAGTHEKAPY